VVPAAGDGNAKRRAPLDGRPESFEGGRAVGTGREHGIDIIAVTLSGGSLAVAGWAAWNAHQAREWQRRRDEERRATRIHVEFAHSIHPRG
jgi:hypothetical protein